MAYPVISRQLRPIRLPWKNWMKASDPAPYKGCIIFLLIIYQLCCSGLEYGRRDISDSSAHVWRLVKGGEFWVTGRSTVLVLSSLIQLLLILCGNIHLYPSNSQREGDGTRAHHSYGEENNNCLPAGTYIYKRNFYSSYMCTLLRIDHQYCKHICKSCSQKWNCYYVGCTHALTLVSYTTQSQHFLVMWQSGMALIVSFVVKFTWLWNSHDKGLC